MLVLALTYSQPSHQTCTRVIHYRLRSFQSLLFRFRDTCPANVAIRVVLHLSRRGRYTGAYQLRPDRENAMNQEEHTWPQRSLNLTQLRTAIYVRVPANVLPGFE